MKWHTTCGLGPKERKKEKAEAFGPQLPGGYNLNGMAVIIFFLSFGRGHAHINIGMRLISPKVTKKKIRRDGDHFVR